MSRRRPVRRPPTPSSSGTSASSRARNAGSRNACACSATGNPATSRHAGNMRNGWYDDCSPTSSPTGRGATWPRIGSPSATDSSIRPNKPRHASGWRWLCASDSDSGRPDALDHRAHELELAVGVGIEVRDQLDHPVPGVGHARGDRLELVDPRPQRRRRVAARGPVVQRPRRREPDRAVTHRLGGQFAHGRRVLLRRILQAGGPFPHDVEAQRAVGELRAQVDVVRPALDRVEVFAEALPRPLDALVQHRAGDVLDALHQRDELVVRVRAAPARSRRRSCPSPPWSRRASSRGRGTSPTWPGRRSACGCRRTRA